MSKKHLGLIGIITLALVICAAMIAGYITFAYKLRGTNPQPQQTQQTQPTPRITYNADYYLLDGQAQRSYKDAKEGQITYCNLDSLGRPTCAYSLLTTDMRQKAKARGRQHIDVNPTGWPKHNQKVTITDGSQSYTGWFWNRSHMVADSLGGDPVKENLVTGTRTQNVGISSAHNGGMAYSETKARSYLDNQAHASCPLYYAVTPNYTGNELIPRTVTVDMESCDKSISEHITVPNTANGYTIDYNTAEIRTSK